MKNYCSHCHQADDHVNLELPTGLTPRQTLHCPSCHRLVVLVNVKSAAMIVQRSHQTIYEWMRTSRIHYVQEAGGRRLIIYSSLFLPPDYQNENETDGKSSIEAATPAKRRSCA